MIGGRVFDASAIADFATGRTRYTEAVVWTSVEQQIVVLIPAVALTVALAQLPASRHDVVGVLLSLPVTVTAELTARIAPDVARLMRAADGRNPAGLAVAHTVCCARGRNWPVLTADPGPVRELWPQAPIEALP